jgi:hypothetical protein
MLDKEIIEIRRIWDETKARHLDYFKFNAKSGHQFIVKQQNDFFNIYAKNNKLIANNISNIEDLANCMTMIANTK